MKKSFQLRIPAALFIVVLLLSGCGGSNTSSSLSVDSPSDSTQQAVSSGSESDERVSDILADMDVSSTSSSVSVPTNDGITLEFMNEAIAFPVTLPFEGTTVEIWSTWGGEINYDTETNIVTVPYDLGHEPKLLAGEYEVIENHPYNNTEVRALKLADDTSPYPAIYPLVDLPDGLGFYIDNGLERYYIVRPPADVIVSLLENDETLPFEPEISFLT